MDAILHDLRYALRTLRGSPAFAGVAVVTLALGIGASTAIFGVIDNLLFRPPHFRHVDRLVYLLDTNTRKVPPDAEVPPSPGNMLDWRERAHSFDHMAAWRNWYYSVSSPEAHPGAPESVRGVRVSPSFFPMLGVDAALGRTFREEEADPGRDQVVVLSNDLWSRRFAADPTIVGRQVLVDARPLTVIGVLPRDFQFYQPDLDLWMPLTVDAGLRDRQNHSVFVFARLAPDVSPGEAQSELDRITRQLADEHPDTNAGWGARVVPLFPSREVRDVKPALFLLLGAAGLMLLIACVNTANLLLGRAVARQREVAIRAAIGASRWRLVRQMLTESSVLAVASGAAGVVLAHRGARVLDALLPHAGTNRTMGTFGPIAPALDLRALAFSMSVALVTGVMFGLIPALQTTRIECLRLSATSSRRPRPGRPLMIAELTLSIVLLVGAALLLKSFWRLQQVDPGFRPDHLLTMQVWLPKTKYAEPAGARDFYEQVLRRIGRLPGVRAAGAVSFRPFLGMAMSTPVDVDGRAPRQADEASSVGYDVVTPGYLQLLGQPLRRGRDLALGDGPESIGVAVVNEAMARQFWPHEDPVGKRIRPGFSRTDVPWAIDASTRWLTVVGVAADIKEFRLNEQPRPLMYISHRQFPSSFMYVMVRTAIAPEMLATSIQREISAVDPDQPVSNVRTMGQAIGEAVPRFDVGLLGLFAAIALLLSAIGVYGVTSYGVSRRTSEIGIRMALGASRGDILLMIVREALVVGAISVALGVAGARGLSRVMVNMLYGVTPTDVGAVAGASVVLLATALIAAYLPARRAASVHPLSALRTE
jgi:putative ABC transport system permease protein